MKQITIFGVESFDNNYMNTEFHQLCIKSWERLKNYFINRGYSCQIKIYKLFEDTDVDVARFKKEYPFWGNRLSTPSKISNVFRLYILSKYENHFYLDFDVYVDKNIETRFCFNDSIFLLHNWSRIYNGTNTGLFKELVAKYFTGEFNLNLKDVEASDLFKLSDRLSIDTEYNYSLQCVLKHLCQLEYDRKLPQDDWEFINDLNEAETLPDKLIYDGKRQDWTKAYISKYVSLNIKNCLDGNEDLIELIDRYFVENRPLVRYLPAGTKAEVIDWAKETYDGTF